jgi:hypothetical protein
MNLKDCIANLQLVEAAKKWKINLGEVDEPESQNRQG